jgi:bifunctional DNA-binding transcriptional regulator/antitoxin component of YhaV-PrlF toxin-antitoxin module
MKLSTKQRNFQQMNHSSTAIVSSSGKITLPALIRKALKLDGQRQLVRFELNDDDSAWFYPVRDALDLKGAFADLSRPYDPKESEKAWAAVAKAVARKGRRRMEK